MAKIKSPLLMADGARVRTMEELREHFDIASVLAHYDSGKLREWLENYYYDKEAGEVGALDPSSEGIEEKICGILGVACSEEEAGNIDLADVSNRNRRLAKLKKYTGEDELLKAVEYVAFSQEELQNLLDKGVKKVYLCQEQEKFEIPDVEGVTYIGVNHPSASVPGWFGEKGIVLQNVDIGVDEMLAAAEKCFSDKNYTEAVELWSKAAALGNTEAQYRLGKCYYCGDGVAEDREEAFKWSMKAAKQGYAEAQFEVGTCYFFGQGVAEDEEEAFKWCMKAAKQGYAEAQYWVGFCYCNEFGEAKDKEEAFKCKEEAFKWYLKAAKQGYAEAQYDVGVCYFFGKGVAEDKEEAFKWYLKAAKQGHAEAQYDVGDCYKCGGGVAEDKEEAYQWYLKAAEQGHVEAQYEVGQCYGKGAGVEQDTKKALEWYDKAREKGHEGAREAWHDLMAKVQN